MLNIKLNHKLTFSDADKARFTAIMEKSQAVDAWSSASQYVMANAILTAFDFVQSNLNKTAVGIAEGELNKKTKSGKAVNLSEKKKAAFEAIITSKGADTVRANFDDKNIEASIYEAADWDAKKPKSSDGQFNKLVKRATKTAIVIWENPKEYAMKVSPMLDEAGKPILDDAGNARETLQPIEAAYLAYDGNKKHPGKMLVEGKFMPAKTNPDMFEEDKTPKMEDSGWRSLEAAYKKLHPGKTGGEALATTDAEAFKILSESKSVPDTTKLAAAKSVAIRLGTDPSKAIDTMGKAIDGARELSTVLAEALRKIDDAITARAAEAKVKGEADAKAAAQAAAKRQALLEKATAA